MIELNKVFLTGRLTRDPETKHLPSGTQICDMRVASDRSYWDKASSERKKDTLFINVTAWAKTAEFCAKFMSKGSAIYIEGNLRHETWDDKDGNKRERISITADRVQFGESRAEAEARGNDTYRPSGDTGTRKAAEKQAPVEDDPDLPF